MTSIPQASQPDTATVTRRRLLAGALAAAVPSVAPLHLGAPATASASAGTPVLATPTPTPALAADASAEFRAVAAALAAPMAATGTPCGALGVFADGREEYAAFGVTSVEGGCIGRGPYPLSESAPPPGP